MCKNQISLITPLFDLIDIIYLWDVCGYYLFMEKKRERMGKT